MTDTDLRAAKDDTDRAVLDTKGSYTIVEPIELQNEHNANTAIALWETATPTGAPLVSNLSAAQHRLSSTHMRSSQPTNYQLPTPQAPTDICSLPGLPQRKKEKTLPCGPWVKGGAVRLLWSEGRAGSQRKRL